MADPKEQILIEIQKLIASGKSIVITTVDEPLAEGYAVDFELNDVSRSASGRRCIQFAILPDGTKICLRYED